MPLRALLYRRPSEPRTIEIVFDRSVYLVQLRRHRQARRYTLRIQATTREVILTIPPRGTLKEAGEFAQKHGGWIAARLGRLPEAAPFADGVVVPLRGVPHRIAHRRGMRGTVWAEVADDGERLLCVAGNAPHLDRRVGDYPAPRGQARARSRELEICRGARRRRQADHRARSIEPLGLVLDHRHAVVLVAAHSGAEPCARLSRRARSGAPRRDEPFAAVLAAGAAALPGHDRAKAWLDAHGADLHRYGLPDAGREPH